MISKVVDDLGAVAQERDEEITRIARSIEELSQIFKELAVLVIDQGTILDRIDFNMEQVRSAHMVIAFSWQGSLRTTCLPLLPG